MYVSLSTQDFSQSALTFGFSKLLITPFVSIMEKKTHPKEHLNSK